MLALTNSAQALSKCISLEASIETIISMVITTTTRTFNLTVSTPTAPQTTRFPPDLKPEIRRAAKRQNEQSHLTSTKNAASMRLHQWYLQHHIATAFIYLI
jgi:hypothetical protein